MANLAFSKKEPWEQTHEAMTKYILDQTDGAFEIKNQNGALHVYAEGPDTVPLGPEGYMINPPSAYHKGPLYQFDLWDGGVCTLLFHTDT